VRRRGFHRGFTLIEMLTVIVLLSIMAGLILPRMAGRAHDPGRSAAEGARDLLSAAGQRAALTSQPLMVAYSDGVLEVRTPVTGERAEWQGSRERWGTDPYAPIVRFEGSELVEALADGVRLGSGDWTVEFARAERRPDLELRIRGMGERLWTVRLASGALLATMTDDADAIGPLEPVDLDASGGRYDAW